MNISFRPELASGYTNKSQMARVLTEDWTASNLYCPVCGWARVEKFPNNRAVADFFCPHCGNEYEQKSKNGRFGSKIADGAYDTFVQRICAANNPDFLIMQYSLEKMRVESLIFVPKHFFVPEIVEKRPPLRDTAQRAGWVGCNILLDRIPRQGRISIIENEIPAQRDAVLAQVQQSQRLAVGDLRARGWLLDVLSCVNRTAGEVFTLGEIYAFADELSARHPNNNNIHAKIRQQLQFLRDRGALLFLGGGRYRKV